MRRWFDERVLSAFADRVLRPAGRTDILATYRVPEHAPFDDALIAAIAQVDQMTVATRDTKHFQPLGVRCLNPWDPSSGEASSTTSH